MVNNTPSSVQQNHLPGLVIKEHWFHVPLNWDAPDKPGHGFPSTIKIFCRELSDPASSQSNLPYLLFLQGGPGFASPRPTGASGWIKRALTQYKVILLDQRGTGLSTPVTVSGISRIKDPVQQAAYLKNFRAPSIVKDCEHIRQSLLGENSQWVVLGQSFGGFCLCTYLSLAPSSIKFGLFTGGLPPLLVSTDEAYRSLYRKVVERNTRFYNRYPQDIAAVKKIVKFLKTNDVRLPSGGKLSARRFQQLGIMLGSQSGVEQLHYLIEDAFAEADDRLSYSFLRKVEGNQSFWDTNPIYSVLHEPIYCEGVASKWSAERVLSEFSSFDISKVDEAEPVYFTGEMVYSWMFDGEYSELSKLKEVAHILANDDKWGKLYDISSLQGCKVPCAAAVYYDDMYVYFDYSMKLSNVMKNIKVYVTNEYQHNGLWEDGEGILSKLLDMCNNRTNIPS